MCGIAGFIDLVGRSPAANRWLAEAMGDAIRHRGPDRGATWESPAGVWLSFRRLAIVDLTEAGDQPMSTPDGSCVIIFNGEAYNAADLKPDLEAAGYRFRGHSDTEIVLYACQHWGVAEAMRRLNGMFALAYWDEGSRTLSLVRDRLGKKPIYWFHTDRTFAFASELRPLLLHDDCPREIDRSSVADLLRLLYVPAPHSIFQNVNKLEPATVLTVHALSGRVEKQPYWALGDVVRRAIANPFKGSPEEAVAETERLLLDATRIRLISDVPLGAFLSGGIDSSTITALMQEMGNDRIRTFSIGYSNREYDESRDAEAVAAHLGADHTSFVVEPSDALSVIPNMPAIFDEPFADTSQIPTYLVSHLARQHVTVALTGDGGDEVFAGYNRHVAANGLLGSFFSLPRPVRTGLAGIMTALSPDNWQKLLQVLPSHVRPRTLGEKLHKLAPLLQLDEAQQYRRIVSYWADPAELVLDGKPHPSLIDDPTAASFLPDAVARMRYLDIATFLPGDILTKVDRASMACSLEARSPLLDHRLVEWSFRVPSALHLRDGRGKWLLRQILEKRVPRNLIDRPKTGFGLPVGEWLRGPLRPWAEELLDERRLRSTGLIEPLPVRSLWRRHLSGQTNGQYLLWPILMLMGWLDAYAPTAAIDQRRLRKTA